MFNVVPDYIPHSSPAEALNNGSLPFVGRRLELEFLASCFRRSLQSQRLQTTLVIGEAGIGKSRLVESFMTHLQSEGATVVYTRLPVESSAPLAPHILRACHAAGIRERKGEPAGSISTVLRRHAQMRPTVVVVEDIDLLRGTGLYDFSLFVETLVDERMLLVSTARPACHGARAVLEQHPLDEVMLNGLPRQELALLLISLFGEKIDMGILDQLEDASLGNPLAVRSALRGMIRTGALRYDPSTDRWVTTISGQLLTHSLRHNVELLLQGMTVPLGADERESASQLAVLGRTFSRRTAQSLVEQSDALVERLIQTGLASTCRELPPSLPGEEDTMPPVMFTHTLVHRFLSEQATLDPHRLLATVSRGLPLFSPLPFQHLSRTIAGVDVDDTTIRTVVMRALDVAAALDRTPSWQGALPLWESASLLALAPARQESTTSRDELDAVLLREKIILMRRSRGDDAAIELAGEILTMIEGAPDSLQIRSARLVALGTLQIVELRRSASIAPSSIDEIGSLLVADPALYSTPGFRYYIEQLMANALESFDARVVRMVDSSIERLDAMTSPAGQATGAIPPSILHSSLVSDAGGEMETSPQRNDLPFRMPLQGMGFLLYEGVVSEAIALSEHAAPHLEELGLMFCRFESLVNRLALQAGYGLDPLEIDATIAAAIAEAPIGLRSRMGGMARLALRHMALLRGDSEWMARINAAGTAPSRPMPAVLRMMIAVTDKSSGDILSMAGETEADADPLLLLPHSLRSSNWEEKWEAIDGYLSGSIVNLLTLLKRITAIDMLLLLAGEEITQMEHARIRVAVIDALTWLAAKGYSAFMLPLLESHEQFLVRKEAVLWRSRISQLATEFRVTTGSEPEGPSITISMLGSIQIGRNGEEPARMRGARLSVVLGLLVADQMLDTPLSYSEFCQLASDGESNPDRARDTVNGAVYRLRGVLGSDAILTDAETPRLNLARVHVDLIEAHKLLQHSSRTMNEGALMHAVPPLLKALRIVAGAVPFPGLYDNFFEASREDFEHKLRSAVIAVSGRLLREGEIAGAEEALRVAFEGMPEDEEIAGLLCDAMILLGKRTEAERVRMRLAKSNAA